VFHDGPREKRPPWGRRAFGSVGAWGASLPSRLKPQKQGGMFSMETFFKILLSRLAALSDLASSLSQSIKQIIVDIVEFLTPLVTVICIGMIIVGAILIALRQEFYGIRLIIGGGVGLAILYLVIPLLLGFLP
jgi:hypothetical protein